MGPDEESKRSPLHDRHVSLGATMGDFGGWLMPIEYSGTLGEHEAVRQRVGIFDVSHMGKVRVHGAGAIDFLNSMLTNDLNRVGAGQAQYSLLCDESGGVIDDLIVYRWADDELFIVPNAGNAAEVVSVLRTAAPDGIAIDDHHLDHGIIAVQGPQSGELVEAIGLPARHEYMSMVSAEYAGQPVVVARTGYTGEHGYELVLPVSILGQVWDALIASGAQPAGLGARDTLRLEMGYPLHGHELSREISPVQARLGWAVGWDKPSFAGRDSLVAEREAGPQRVLRGLLAEGRGIPRADLVVMQGDQRVGITTSGTFSPTLRQGVALALLDPSVSEGDHLVVDVRGRPLDVVVVRPPFVPAHVRD